MKCLDEETIEALAAGALDHPTRAEATAHVRQCPACREALRQTVVLHRALGPVFARETREDCPSGEQLALYDEGELDSAARGRIEQHVTACVRCAADLRELKTERKEIIQTERELAASKALRVVYPVAATIPSIQAWLGRAAGRACRFLDAVQLACFRPKTARAALLAADTGGGFQRQLLTQPESPFDVEMAQFGAEVRVTLKAKADMAECSDCLVRLILAEGQTVKLARPVVVKDGRGACMLRPDEVVACMPDSQTLTAEVELVDTRQALQSFEESGAGEALIGLLAHPDPAVRRSVVELISAAGLTNAGKALAALRNDPDEGVRAAVERALAGFSND